jgi:hypothetical protein
LTRKAYDWNGNFQDQWNKKKQTKEEAKRAKMAKLDPASAKSAKDVMEERAKKRKRDDEELSAVDGTNLEQPKEGLKRPEANKHRKKKKKQNGVAAGGDEGTHTAAEDTNAADDLLASGAANGIAEEAEPKRTRKDRKSSKTEARTTGDVAQDDESRHNRNASDVRGEPANDNSATASQAAATTESHSKNARSKPDLRIVPATAAEAADEHASSTAASSPAQASITFDDSGAPSAASSTTSIEPPASSASSLSSSTDQPKKKKPLVDSEELRARLRARIEALREARHADGPNGTRARNRQELMEARRRKEEERRARKKELRAKAKEEERQARDRALALSRSSNSSSPMPPPPAAPDMALSFGRMAFKDGQRVDATASTLLDAPRHKGPQDPMGAMKAAEAKRARLNGLDEQKRKDIEEKDMWLNARKRIHGEKVKDDTSLLKKTLKRHEKTKHKSETEWKDRLGAVEKGKEMRQKKREENLKKRRDEKGSKGKKGSVQKRPGFEGTFRAKPKARAQ